MEYTIQNEKKSVEEIQQITFNIIEQLTRGGN